MAQHITDLCYDDTEFLGDAKVPIIPGMLTHPTDVVDRLGRRNELLIKQYGNRRLSQEELEFLKTYGGDLSDIKQLSDWQIFYRYSIGDAITSCLAWSAKGYHISEFKKRYDAWLQDNYKLKVDNNSSKCRKKVPGKRIPVSIETFSFNQIWMKLRSIRPI